MKMRMNVKMLENCRRSRLHTKSSRRGWNKHTHTQSKRRREEWET